MSTTVSPDEWNPIDYPQDYVLVAGRKTPGVADVVGADSPRNWDEREGYGLSGALLVFHGLKLSHFVINIRLFTQSDWADWRKFRPLVLKPPIGKRQKALDVAHPLLEQVGIRSAVVDNLKTAQQTDNGEWTISIEMIEFRGPRVALAKPDGSQAGPTDPYDIAIDANNKYIDQMTEELAQ